MKAYSELPAAYHEIRSIDLQKDKKKALWINGAASAGMILLAVIGHFCFVPVVEFFTGSASDSLLGTLSKPLVLLVGMLAYIVLHELTHAAAMKAVGGTHVRFGFTGLYAYAGSERDWFDRNAYLLIALAPVVCWGLTFTILLILVPRSWFWVVYILQIINVTGSAGDFYVSWLAAHMPDRLLVRDTGVSMSFYLDS